jgi:hypothetical protein
MDTQVAAPVQSAIAITAWSAIRDRVGIAGARD